MVALAMPCLLVQAGNLTIIQGFLCVRATELAGRVPRPEGNCVDSRLHVGFHVL